MQEDNYYESHVIVLAGPKRSGKTAAIRRLLGTYTPDDSPQKQLIVKDEEQPGKAVYEQTKRNYKPTTLSHAYKYTTPSRMKLWIRDTGSFEHENRKQDYR